MCSKWIGFSSQSDSHCIYWLDTHKVSVERNILFDKEKLHQYAPTLPTEDQIQKLIDKAHKTGSNTPLMKTDTIPEATIDDISKEHEVEDMIELSPQEGLEDLQPSRKKVTTVEQTQQRRSERIYQKTHLIIPPGPITQAMAKKGVTQQSTLLALLEDNNSTEALAPKKFGLNSNNSSTHISQNDDNVLISMTNLSTLTEPITLDEALKNPIWKKSMDKELKPQIDKNTWELVIPPKGVNIIGSKWTHCLKKNDVNRTVRPKSRLVAQGFTQTFGVNYNETYALVV